MRCGYCLSLWPRRGRTSCCPKTKLASAGNRDKKDCGAILFMNLEKFEEGGAKLEDLRAGSACKGAMLIAASSAGGAWCSPAWKQRVDW